MEPISPLLFWIHLELTIGSYGQIAVIVRGTAVVVEQSDTADPEVLGATLDEDSRHSTVASLALQFAQRLLHRLVSELAIGLESRLVQLVLETRDWETKQALAMLASVEPLWLVTLEGYPICLAGFPSACQEARIVLQCGSGSTYGK